MLKNYLKIALRNLRKHKGYTVINVAGLAVGLACAIAVLLIVRREYAVNQNLSHVDDLYRVSTEWKSEGMGSRITTLAPVGPLMQANFPEVLGFNRSWGGWVVLNIADQAFREDMVIADTSFFELFDFRFLAGEPNTAFAQPNAVVITEDLARKCFGTTDVLGKTVALQVWSGAGKRDYRITGVLETLPRTSVTHYTDEGFTVFMSTRNLEDFMDRMVFESWDSRFVVTYVRLRKGTSARKLNGKLAQLLNEHCPESLRSNFELKLEPLARLHLTDFGGQVQKALNGYLVFAALMLLVACINFINISTARAAQRATEVGIRRVFGGQRRELVRQFMFEAAAFVALAMLLSLGLVEMFLRLFRESVMRGLNLGQIWHGGMIAALLGLLLLTCLLAGAYPAFVLSRFQPVSALKGGLRSGKGAARLRRLLVVAQFASAVFVAVAALVVSGQLSYLTERDLGFRQEQMLVIQSVPREWSFDGVQKQEVLLRALRRLPEVASVSLSFDVPADYGSGSLDLTAAGLPEGESVAAMRFTVDESYLDVFDIKLAAGRFFSRDFFHADTSNSVVLNRAAARALKLDNPVGASVKLSDGAALRVIGVVENFSFSPLERDDRPLVFMYVYGAPIYRYLSVKLQAENLHESVERIQSIWKATYPDVPFEYRFLDDVVQSHFQQIEHTRTLTRYATMLALFIGSLGLLGLAAYAAEQRTKEIGIRKVLGASVTNIIALVSGDFVKLVLAANLIAWPLAWYAMHKWLQNFAYRIEISWWIFVLAGGLALLIALLTVSTQAVRAALANPVESLRYE